MTSLFGGDVTMAHYTASVVYRHTDPNGREIREAQRQALKALGFKTQYFQFKANDKEAKEKAKIACEKFAVEWENKVGFKLEVNEGCFL